MIKQEQRSIKMTEKIKEAIKLVNNSQQEIRIEGGDSDNGYSVSFCLLIESESKALELANALITVFSKLKIEKNDWRK